jgi:hypothetical protein
MVNPILIKKSFLTVSLLKFVVHKDESLLVFKNHLIINKRITIIDIITLLILKISKITNRSIFNSKYIKTEDKHLVLGLNTYMGYFHEISHYPKHFRKYSNELISNLNIKSPKDRIAIHLRFGDSVWAKEHSSYYEEIKKIIKNFDDEIFFISDDHSECKKFALECDINFKIFKDSMINEFRFLSESSFCICAPSTFSWWAATLNAKEKKKIIMPYFFKEKFKINYTNIQYIQ